MSVGLASVQLHKHVGRTALHEDESVHCEQTLPLPVVETSASVAEIMSPKLVPPADCTVPALKRRPLSASTALPATPSASRRRAAALLAPAEKKTTSMLTSGVTDAGNSNDGCHTSRSTNNTAEGNAVSTGTTDECSTPRPARNHHQQNLHRWHRG